MARVWTPQDVYEYQVARAAMKAAQTGQPIPDEVLWEDLSVDQQGAYTLTAQEWNTSGCCGD